MNKAQSIKVRLPDGVVRQYKSLSDAAASLRVSRPSLLKRLGKNRDGIHTYETLTNHRRTPAPPNSVKTRIQMPNGEIVEYPTRAAAAKALKVSTYTIASRMREAEGVLRYDDVLAFGGAGRITFPVQLPDGVRLFRSWASMAEYCSVSAPTVKSRYMKAKQEGRIPLLADVQGGPVK